MGLTWKRWCCSGVGWAGLTWTHVTGDYINRYIIDVALSPSLVKVRNTLMVYYRTGKGGWSSGRTYASQKRTISWNYGNNHRIVLVRTAYYYIPTSESNPFTGHQLNRAARRENKRVHRFYDAAYKRFLGRHVQRVEEGLCQCDQRGLFQHLKSLNIEDTRKVSSQYIRDEKGRMLRDAGLVLGRWARSSGTFLNAKSLLGSPRCLSHTLSGSNRQKTRSMASASKGSGTRWTPCWAPQTRG